MSVSSQGDFQTDARTGAQTPLYTSVHDWAESDGALAQEERDETAVEEEHQINDDAQLKWQSFDLTFCCMPVNPGVYRHPGQPSHISECSKMRGNTVCSSYID